MKHVNIVTLFLFRCLVVAVLAGCDLTGVQGNGIEKRIELSGASFDRLSVSSGARIVLVPGDACRAVIRIDENLSSRLDREVSGGTLSIGFEEGSFCPTLYEIEVTAPGLKRISLSGGCRATGSFAALPGLEVNLSGGSTLCCTLSGTPVPLDAGDNRCVLDDPETPEPVVEPLVPDVPASPADIALSLSGGSCCSLKGSARDLNLSLSGGSCGKLGDLSVRDIRYALSGGSEAWIRASGSVTGSLSGGARLYRH